MVDVTFLHGHRRLLVARRKSTSLLDPATGEQYPLPGDGPALSPRWVTPGNGRVFAMTLETNPRLIRWDDDGAGVLREAASVPMHPETLPLALSGDARWLAVATRDGQVPVVRLLDAARLATSPMMELRHGTDEDLGTPNAVTFAEFLDDAPTLLTGTKNGHFRIWREATGSFDSVLLEPDEEIDLEKAFYSRTYRLLYVYRNKAVELWDLSSGGVERVVRRAAGRNLSHREWRESLLRNYPYHSTFRGLPAEFDLRLMYSQSNVSSIPTSGTNLVIVANVNDVLHFRIFDADGKVVVDTDQTRLTTQAGSIEDLKRQLDGVRPPHELTRSEKDQVVTAVTSIVGHILPAIHDR